MRKVRILSIDAGGIRGLIPALILEEIERKTQKPICKTFDLIAGTSTGGILALGLVAPGADSNPKFTASDLVDFYTKRSPSIFEKSFWGSTIPFYDYFRPKYIKNGFEKELESLIGQAKLSDALTEVLIPAYEIEKRETNFFKSRKVKLKTQEDYYMKDVARSTAAAPSFFPIAKISPIGTKEYRYYIDGATFASDPAMCAYAEAINMYEDLDNLVIVSLGAGNYSQPISYRKAKKWGMLLWTVPLLSVLFDGMPDTVEYQLKKIFSEENKTMKFFRFQPEITATTEKIDDTSQKNISSLIEITKKYIEANNEHIELACKALIDE